MNDDSHSRDPERGNSIVTGAPVSAPSPFSWSAAALLILVGIGVAVWLASPRGVHSGLVSSRIESAATATALREDLVRQVTIQAEFRPYQEIELHPKVAGYLKSLNVDVGDR